MNAPISEAFNDVIREKRIDKSLLMETLTAGFSSAAKKKFGASAEVEVTEDKQGNLTLYLLKTVVSEVESPANEITKVEAKEYDKKVKVGDTVKINVPFTDFGRNAIQIAKQILMQKIREFERDRTFDEYEDRVGEIVSGSVQQIDRNGILVNLGNAEATMPKKEQIRRERYNQGASIRACIIKVDKEAKGPMITLSRTSTDFLKKLFSQEVPEIYEGIIEIKNVAREAGGRSKIAVYSRDDRVDAVGACVGMKGSRVQAVVNELSGERIDIVPWNEDITAFVSRALSPAKISGVRADSEEQRVLVIVDEDQLSLAIGKDGQNVRLGSKLTGWQIDLITSRELEQRERLQEHLTMGIEEMAGVSVRVAEKLRAAGITTVQKFSKTPLEELLEIPGFGPKTIEKLQETAQATIEELDKALRELIAKEEEERAKEKETEKPLFDESILNEEGTSEEAPVLTEEALFSKSAEDSELTGPEADVAEATKEEAVADESEEEVSVEEAEQAVAEEPEEADAVEDAAVDDVAAETVSDETKADTEKNPS
ncbi:MAG: transcription termination factor NusA [bacterium]|nr:transcription termination factor NusA [bacterium]